MPKLIISTIAIALIFSLAIATPNIKSNNLPLNNTLKGKTESIDNDQPTIPQMINYQGKLTDAGGNPQNGNFDMTFKIFNALTGGTEYWTETQTGVTVTNGLFNVLLGSVNSIDPATEFPTGPNCYLEITVGTQTIAPRQRIVSAGYSYYADDADDAANLGGIPASSYVVNPHDHLGETWTTTTDDIGIMTIVDRNTSSPIYGRIDSVLNSGFGDAYGGRFVAGGSGTGIKFGVYSCATAPSGSNNSGYGFYGVNFHNGNGLAYGGCFNATGSGTGIKFGVYGDAFAPSGSSNQCYGVYGNMDHEGSGNAQGGHFSAGGGGTGAKYGVYGDVTAPSGSSNPGYAFFGNSTHAGIGSAYGARLTAGGSGAGNKYGVYSLVSGSGTRFAGYFVGDHVITGTKSAAVKIDNNDWRLVYCQESPELWFEDFGQGQLQNGRARIELEPIFFKTVTISKEHPMNVFVQLKDDCNGVYVKDGKTGFDVIELQNGKSNAQFTYRVVAKRAGYENLRLKRMEPGTNPEELEAEHAKERAEMERERNKTR